jgi:5-methylcytosine-specific restriction endonuclease McrA
MGWKRKPQSVVVADETDRKKRAAAVQRARFAKLLKQRDANGMQMRALVWAMSNGRCAYCNKQTNPFHDFTVDHIRPLSNNGSDKLDNLLPCCRSCNGRKRSKSLSEFRVACCVFFFPFETEDWWIV